MAQIAGDQAALMDSVYRKQRHIYDFTRKYYLFGRDRLIAELAAQPGQSVVEIGCGTARNLIKMARLYPQTTFFGLDASKEMLVTARQAIARSGLCGRIRLAQGFAENLSPAMFGQAAPFDHAIFSYSLSMISDWKQALKSAAGAVGAGGEIHIVDFGDLTGLGLLGARVLSGWLSLFRVSPRVEILHGLETMKYEKEFRNSQLVILCARYGFLWRGESKELQPLVP